MTSSSNLKAVLVNSNTEDDKYTKEFESPLSALTHVIDDIKYGTLSAAIKTSLLGPAINRYLTNKAGSSGGNRPYQFSCKSDYTSYDSLTDYSYYGRHVDGMPDEWVNSLPDIDKVLKLFKRPDVLDDKGVKTGELQTMCIRSTMLFPTFAQHLVDSFIVTNFKAQTKNSTAPTEFNWRKTDTPHDIGLLTVYGLTIEETMQLRLQSTTKGKLGRMKTQSINGEDWGPFLFDSNGDKKKEFDAIPYPQGLDHILMYRKPEEIKEIKSKIFAFGGARTNLTPNIVAWNTLLLREHNRIASEIEESEPTWDDERVFQTARNVLLAMYLKLVIEEYINHITKYEVDFVVSPGPWMWNAPWYVNTF
jgi:prostaglandin-endoperoxide synthase 2